MVVFYNPRSSAQRKPIVPCAHLALAASLEGRVPWRLVDGNLVDPVVGCSIAFDELARHGGPPILAVTAMPGPQLAEAVPTVASLQERIPGLVVIWGGYFATQHTRACLASDRVDFVLRRHADEVFPKLVDALQEGTDWRQLPGLAWRDADGVHQNPDAPLPHPDKQPPWPDLDLSAYVRPTVLGARTLGMHTSYGCPYLCNFCAVVSMVEGRWKAWSAERAAAQAERWTRRYGLDALELYDNNFFVKESRCVEFAERISGLGLTWWGEGRIDTLLGFDDATWRTMADSGLRMVFMGAEAGSAETLANMDKGGTLTPEHTLSLVERMGRFGVVPELSFVLGNPPDPAADAERTLAFVREVKALNPRAEIILYLYTPEPVAGGLLDGAEGAGFAFPQTLEAWVSPEWLDHTQRRSEDLPWLPPGLRQQIRDFERVLNAWYPTSTDLRLQGPRRWLLRGTAAWRWHTGTYARPWELALLQRVLRYQRPETSGF